MLVKAVTLFLIAIAALAMFGKLRLPGRSLRLGRPGKCARCGRFMLGRGATCACGTRRG